MLRMMCVVDHTLHGGQWVHGPVSHPDTPAATAHDFLHGGNQRFNVYVTIVMHPFVTSGIATLAGMHTYEPGSIRQSEASKRCFQFLPLTRFHREYWWPIPPFGIHCEVLGTASNREHVTRDIVSHQHPARHCGQQLTPDRAVHKPDMGAPVVDQGWVADPTRMSEHKVSSPRERTQARKLDEAVNLSSQMTDALSDHRQAAPAGEVEQ